MQPYTFPARAARLSAGLAIGLLMGVSGLSGAQAATAHPDQVQHLIDCFHLLLTDGALHARECSPSTVPPWDPLAPTSGGGTYCVPYVTSIDVPAPGVEIASLGDGRDYLSKAAPAGPLLATGYCCVNEATRSPLPDDSLVASLGTLERLPSGDSVVSPRTTLVAYYCPAP